MKHIRKIKGCFYQKLSLFKHHWEPPRKAASWEHSIVIHAISKAGYVTTVLAIVRTELRAREQAVSVIFEKWPLAISPYFIPIWLKQT